MLTLIVPLKEKAGRNRLGLFRCECGVEKKIALSLVKNNRIRSCGCASFIKKPRKEIFCPCGSSIFLTDKELSGGRKKYCSKECLNKYRGQTIKEKDDLLGRKFGKLTVIGLSGISRHKTRRWECICECGTKKIIEGQSLRDGNTKSCGCIRKEKEEQTPLDRRGRTRVPDICGIYTITSPPGEVYVGGSRTIYKRWLRHKEARKKLKLHESLKKHGWRKHKFEIAHQLPNDVSDEVLLVYEQLYIDQYRGCGVTMLNVKDAGSSAKFPEESKIKMSEAHKGKIPWNKGLKGGNAMAKTYKQNKK